MLWSSVTIHDGWQKRQYDPNGRRTDYDSDAFGNLARVLEYNTGGATYNLELSQRRAEAVKMQLVALGVSSDRITTVGYGKDFPVAANDTDTNRAINRRVEVVISEGGQVVGARR